MASLTMTEPVPTTNCLRCSTGLVYIMHTQGCSENPNFNAEATAESIKEAAKKAKKRADDLTAKKATIDITSLTYLITDGDVGEAKNGSYDKILTVQIIDGDGDIVGTWSIYFYFSSGVGGGSGIERRMFNTAHLGNNIRINGAYRGLGLSRFMGKILAREIEHMINAQKLREDDLFYIQADASPLVADGKTFWKNIGMTTVLSERGAPDSRFGWDPDPDSGDKYMYVGEFISWANGTQKGTKPESKARLKYLTKVIKSSFGGGRKKRTRKRRKTRKKSKKKRKTKRKTRKKSKKKRKRKTRKNKQFLYNPNNPKKSFDVYIDKNPKDTI